MTRDFDGLEHSPHALAVRTDVSNDTSVRAAIEQDLRLRRRR